LLQNQWFKINLLVVQLSGLSEMFIFADVQSGIFSWSLDFENIFQFGSSKTLENPHKKLMQNQRSTMAYFVSPLHISPLFIK